VELVSNFLNVINILGIFTFAVSGAFSAMERRLDPFGVLIIAFATALGGGTIRDVLIGNLPVGWLTNSTAFIVIFFAALAAMFFGSYIRHLNKAFFLFDALGLGLYTIIGIEFGLRYGFNAGACIVLGTVTASFGGVLRDVLLNKVPLIFQKEIYALACITGGVCYYWLSTTAINSDFAKVICILLIFFIRVIAVRYNLSLPRFRKKQQT
jgi:uncharacterized membrane protein YeiH